MAPEIAKKIDEAGIVAVIVIDEAKHAVPLAKALLRGGVDAIELTLRTPAAMDAAYAIKSEVPEMTLGFGTVITKDQVKAVANVGADFAVAPGCNPKIIEEALEKPNILFIAVDDLRPELGLLWIRDRQNAKY